ncbi:unnamed protein product [Rotaria sordida]|nr:unnamed protein product [Rotaria sordida]CAF0834594.1 unnamed protein product [Rotaria sordida]CAF0844749.1 unnamed protein product [Rotaria sordida]CAF0973642.1 unnamed protein product [Rotaria sordida]CAF1038083.1 unnamed protein product [Rotaria sordida]
MEMLSARYSNRELYWINQYRLIRQYIWTNNRTWNVTNYLQNKYVYWCDCGSHVRISRSFLNGENNIYWSDSRRDTTEVISWDGKNRCTVMLTIYK